MKHPSNERDPDRARAPAAHIDSIVGRAERAPGSPSESAIANTPRMLAQRRQLAAMTNAPIQRVQNYQKSVLESAQAPPEFTTTKVGSFTLPKRMLARPLALPNGLRTDGRDTTHTALWEKLKSEQEAIAYKDGHLLNHSFGGPADSKNMVPISADANTQMIPFDQHVASLLTQGAVVDLEVSANYGRDDGMTSAQNAIPTSLDMRMIPQRLEQHLWVDDPDEHVIVQNVAVNLDSNSNQSQKAKRKSQEYNKRDQMWASFGVLKSTTPNPTEEGPERPNGERARKNEWARQNRYRSFVDLPQWTNWKQEQHRTKRDINAQNIVSGNVVDSAWIGALPPEEMQVEAPQRNINEPIIDEGLLIDTIVSETTHWLLKANIVKNNPGLIGIVRSLGWKEEADLLTEYLHLDLNQLFSQENY